MSETPYFTDVKINGRWVLQLPAFRSIRYLKGDHERERIASMYVNLSDDDILLDVGAEAGDMTALFAGWVNTVVPMEPNPAAWPNMRAIYEANGLPAPVAHWVGFASDTTAVAEHATVEAPFGIGWPDCAAGDLVAAHGFRHLADTDDVARTPQTTIDDFLARPGVPTPTAITMDVEGAEVAALTGAHRLLTEHHPLVWVSVHPDQLRHRFGQGPRHVYELLETYGYRIHHLGDDHETHVLAEPR